MTPRPTPGRAPSPLLLATLLIALAACGGGETSAQDTPAASASPAPAAHARQADLTAADVDLYERGLRQEIALVRAAQERARAAATPQARAEATQAQWETQTIPAAARAIGVAPERYQRVRERLHAVLQTLDFQGKIDGPMELDTARATPEMRARLARDPIAELPPPAAAALRARLDRLAPLFAQYATLTAVGG
jgi:hypothetical protein